MSKVDIKKLYDAAIYESLYGSIDEKVNEKSQADKLKERLAEYLRKIPGLKLVEFVAKATKQSYAQVLKGAMSNVASIGKNGATAVFDYLKDKATTAAKKAGDAIDNAARTDDEKKQHQDEENLKQDDASKEEKEKLEVKDLNLDPHKTTFDCMFDHGDAAKLQDILKEIDEEKKKSLKLAEDIAKQLPERLEKAGCPDIPKDVLNQYGLAIAGLIAKGYKKDKLKKAIDDMQKNNSDSSDDKTNEQKNESLNESMLLNENMLMTGINAALSLVGLGIGTEKSHTESFTQFITHNDDCEIKEMFKQEKSFSMDGVSGGSETAAAGAALWVLAALKATKVIIRHRKELGDMISNFANKVEKKQNVIATMNFMYDDTKYSARYNVKDFKWILVDADNPKEKTDKAVLKSALESELGKKFRKYCSEKWNPIYKPTEGAKESTFDVILNSNDELKLGLKIPKELTLIGNSYDRIEKTCTSDSYNI